MICILGDLHFRSDKYYFIDVCEKVLQWFQCWKYNDEKNELILAGDLVEQAAPGGLTISFLERFISLSKFRKIHICVGNHDSKKINGIQQLAYEFLEHKKCVKIYRVAIEALIDNKKALILPYFTGLNDSGLTMKEYYSSIYQNKKFKNDYDLVVGHFSGDDVFFKEAPDCIQNLDKLSGRVCLGHVHTRSTNPNRYIGSVFAGKKGENDPTRAAWILSDEGWSEDPLPIFNEFCTVTYPGPLPTTHAVIPIYTVLNCGSEVVAKQKYGDIQIRKVTSECIDAGTTKTEDLDRQIGSIKDFNIQELFEEFLKGKVTNIGVEVIDKCRSVLQSSRPVLKVS